jgi:hypothetical protein
VDETTVNWQPPLRACGMKRGQQKGVPVPPDTHHRHHVFGAYDWADDTVTYTTAERTNSMTFSDFLTPLLLDRYPTGPLVLVMDNASYHNRAATRALLSLFDHRVLVLYLPPYCSHLNPIERFGRHLQDSVAVNKLFPCLDLLIAKIECALERQNDLAHVSRFSFSKSEP